MLFIEVEIWSISTTEMRNRAMQGCITLKEKEVESNEARILHIFCAPFELSRLEMHIHRQVFRPLTTDLVKSIIQACQGEILCVVIDSLTSAYVKLRKDRDFELNCAVVDAIDLGIVSEKPIFVAAEVLSEQGILLKDWLDMIQKSWHKQQRKILEEIDERSLQKFKV